MQKVCCVFLVKARKMFSDLRLYRSAEESLLQKKNASQGYEIHLKACFFF